MSDYISKENTVKNIARLNVSVLMGNNKEVEDAICGYNPSSFLAGLSYGLEHAMGMVSGQPPLSETEIIRKYGEKIVKRLNGIRKIREAFTVGYCQYTLSKAIEIVKEECEIDE